MSANALGVDGIPRPCRCGHQAGQHAYGTRWCEHSRACSCQHYRADPNAHPTCPDCDGTGVDPALAGFVGDRDAAQHRLYCLTCYGLGSLEPDGWWADVGLDRNAP